MFKYSVKLKQYSPIIHFQSEQYGATLRATELKPKLDKFLIKYVFNNKKEAYKDYLLSSSNGKEALNYKVQINTNSIPVETRPVYKNNSLYFGNIGDNNEQKQFTLQTNIVFNVDFFSYNNEFLDIIKEFLSSFFATTNFGTRQNKGFGSFYIFDGNRITIDDIKKELTKCKKRFLYIDYSKGNDRFPTTHETILSDIDIIYKLMKSGINFPKSKNYESCYYKGFIYEYMLENGVGNEKRYIKENFFRPIVRVPNDGLEKRYVRAMLGTFKNLEFRDRDRRGTVEFSNDKIKRFKSPITFKIIDKYLLIIEENMENINSENEIFDKKFQLTYVFNEKKFPKEIFTPSKEEFNLWDFLVSFKDRFNRLQVTQSRNPLEKKLKNAKRHIIEVGE